ncbi:hypothetical protein RFI36_04850 [Acinetobacter gerneri]|uniref:DUF4013 domain-containing protein n=1 Tax=Acinetobacter gerneri TaxID=202952 RepID=A0AAW8JGD2_9GAMM|nr:hypothetical protein [Acinetobacter gerneri]MDQ9009002.1 hypothetical protein [Acinetobacter gerneri]MDQ9013106.1 hypothetical protein [Acinetobacter gerneri]MDQ9024543.1 hypothetical protein [Acinetobacter gerneri]MDQ9051778.1 hypothetical protein [Acinetobacter gerneri]MDQ9059242.1 hypothetical protein [Acinetobacter gerneri]
MFELIFKPLNYLSIRWDNGLINKTRFDFIVPLLVTIILSAIMTFLYFKIGTKNSNIFTNDLTYYLICFLQTMPGFYIAALAAISTINSTTMDQPMAGDPPKERYVEHNPYKVFWINMNRRRFLARLFSYLTFISITLFCFLLVIRFSYSLEITIISLPYLVYIVYFFSCVVVIFLLVQLIMMTFLSLYYLGERVHKN